MGASAPTLTVSTWLKKIVFTGALTVIITAIPLVQLFYEFFYDVGK
jgi:hypothetical protein